jgi:hypothetical protein
MAGLLPDDGIAVTLFLQGSVSAHQTRRRSTANPSDISEVLTLHSVERTKYRSSASSETIFHLGENGAIRRVHYLAEKVEPVYIYLTRLVCFCLGSGVAGVGLWPGCM